MQQMQKSKAVLGGEGSGHIICLEQTTSGDGIILSLYFSTYKKIYTSWISD
jgi:phosphoglucosamine mutase